MTEKFVEYDARVISNREIKPGSKVYELVLRVPVEWIKEAGPGMYCAFSPRDPVLYNLRRPFSIVDAFDDKFVFWIKNVGPNSEYYTRLNPGQILHITNPRGKMIQIDEDAKNFILVLGGSGAAAGAFIAKTLYFMKKHLAVLLGGRTDSDIIGLEYFYKYSNNVQVITEDGSGLNQGKVTRLLGNLMAVEKNSISSVKPQVIACGPVRMLEAVYDMCEPAGWPCQVLLEAVFACNMGACLGCRAFLENDVLKSICTDGPAFWAPELNWKILLEAHPPPEKRASIKSCSLKTVLVGQNGRRLELEYPFIGAAGCQSDDALAAGYLSIDYLGAVNVKGPSFLPQRGNLPPRMAETPAGVLNRISLENPGLIIFLAEYLEKYLALGKPVIVNIHDKTIENYVKIAQAFNSTPVAALEVNISCPNEEDGGILFGKSAIRTFELVNAVRRASIKFVIVKLTPNVTDHVEIARAAVDAGADAISFMNALEGMTIDIETSYTKIRGEVAGLTGPAIYPVGIAKVIKLYKANLGVPLICGGGIHNLDTSIQYFLAGSDTNFAGTIGFSNKDIFTDQALGLEAYMLRKGFASVSELTGSMRSYKD